MSQTDYKFLKPIPEISPVDERIATGDKPLEVIAKLQGQIDRLTANPASSGGTPYYIAPEAVFMVQEFTQVLIGMSVINDGYILNDGYIVEVG